jgi:glycerol-3-phosphate dehydrogenase
VGGAVTAINTSVVAPAAAQGRPTGVVAASRDAALAREVQDLFASPSMRVNLTTDVIGAPGALRVVDLGRRERSRLQA